MTLASLFSWADQFKSYLVVNPEDRFSGDEGHRGFQFSVGPSPSIQVFTLAYTLEVKVIGSYNVHSWATSRENLSLEVCDQVRLKPACSAPETT